MCVLPVVYRRAVLRCTRPATAAQCVFYVASWNLEVTCVYTMSTVWWCVTGPLVSWMCLVVVRTWRTCCTSRTGLSAVLVDHPSMYRRRPPCQPSSRRPRSTGLYVALQRTWLTPRHSLTPLTSRHRCSPIVINVTVLWSVCLSLDSVTFSGIMLKRQKISVRFLLHTTAPCLYLAYIGPPFSP